MPNAVPSGQEDSAAGVSACGFVIMLVTLLLSGAALLL
jgi:hypothetical protein